jgi:4-hydroxyphenylpyruvate dioxygenase
VVENAFGALRITLNGAENHRTLAGHFVAEKFGSGVQHLAFRAKDIFATAAALRGNGSPPKSRPTTMSTARQGSGSTQNSPKIEG